MHSIWVDFFKRDGLLNCDDYVPFTKNFNRIAKLFYADTVDSVYNDVQEAFIFISL